MKENRSVVRVMSLLDYLSSVAGQVSLHQIASATKLDKATLLRILGTLEARGWVYRSINDGNYSLGRKAVLLGDKLPQERLMSQLASPLMTEMFELTHWPSDLTVFDGERMVILESTRRLSHNICHRGMIGFRPNLIDSAVGRAYIAAMPHKSLADLLVSAKSEVGIVYTKEFVNALIEQVQQHGYALRERLYHGGIDDHETEISESIAVPIWLQDQVVACINLIYLNSNDDLQLRFHYAEILKHYAVRISQALKQHQYVAPY